MNQALLLSIGHEALRLAAIGVSSTLTTYEVTGRWGSALVVGGITVSAAILAPLSVNGAVAAVQATRPASTPPL